MGVAWYLDDIIIVSQTWTDHIPAIRAVFAQLKKAGLTLKISKFSFACSEVNVLGHLVSTKGISIAPEKVTAVRNYKKPRNIKELATFLGMVTYHMRLVPIFAENVPPLQRLKRKEVCWKWTETEQRAFERIKEIIAEAAMLQVPDPNLPFIETTDASEYAVGAMLSQIQHGREVPLEYSSRVFHGAEANYGIPEKECLAIVYASEKFCHHLHGQHFTAVTDHKALTWLLNQKNPKSKLVRWAVLLQEYDFDVVYLPGKANRVADALSRSVKYLGKDKTVPIKHLMTVFLAAGQEVLAPISLYDIQQALNVDEEWADVLALLKDKKEHQWYELRNGILYRKATPFRPELVVLPKSLHSRIFDMYHN